METLERLKILSSQMHLEPAEEAGCPQGKPPKDLSGMIYQAAAPGGPVSLLKTLLTSACERNCYYCPFRTGRDFRRVTMKPDEMANSFIAMKNAGLVTGLFLSSGIFAGGINTQDKLIATAEILRKKYEYRGYLHLKIMPGAERAQVRRAMELADRVSINLEAPNQERLANLAPRKSFFDELMQPLFWIDEIRKNEPANHSWNGRWPSSVTQFVAGGAGESDLELLTTTQMLYSRLRLRRTYFSAFHPIQDTPLEDQPAVSKRREFRLYQSSFLLRDYHFDLEDLPFEASGNLPVDVDPKTAWAQGNLTEQPIEINLASRQQLLRIPGIGPKLADAILSTRRQCHFKDLSSLKKLGVSVERAAPFILLDGKRPAYQKTLWQVID
jgi:predicted DNA-binding helix-hairpin-helix protein